MLNWLTLLRFILFLEVESKCVKKKEYKNWEKILLWKIWMRGIVMIIRSRSMIGMRIAIRIRKTILKKKRIFKDRIRRLLSRLKWELSLGRLHLWKSRVEGLKKGYWIVVFSRNRTSQIKFSKKNYITYLLKVKRTELSWIRCQRLNKLNFKDKILKKRQGKPLVRKKINSWKP